MKVTYITVKRDDRVVYEGVEPILAEIMSEGVTYTMTAREEDLPLDEMPLYVLLEQRTALQELRAHIHEIEEELRRRGLDER